MKTILLLIVLAGVPASVVMLRPAPQVGMVCGKVTWDGHPVSNGHLEFNPVGEGQVLAAMIENSCYQIELPTGPRRVVVVTKDVVAYTVDRDDTGEPLEDMYVAIEGNIAPAEFGDGSVCQFEVVGGEQTYDVAMSGPRSQPAWIDEAAYISPQNLPVDAWVR